MEGLDVLGLSNHPEPAPPLAESLYVGDTLTISGFRDDLNGCYEVVRRNPKDGYSLELGVERVA